VPIHPGSTIVIEHPFNGTGTWLYGDIVQAEITMDEHAITRPALLFGATSLDHSLDLVEQSGVVNDVRESRFYLSPRFWPTQPRSQPVARVVLPYSGMLLCENAANRLADSPGKPTVILKAFIECPRIADTWYQRAHIPSRGGDVENARDAKCAT
jgi:hypothetical protein